jgi:hypothetical protein
VQRLPGGHQKFFQKTQKGETLRRLSKPNILGKIAQGRSLERTFFTFKISKGKAFLGVRNIQSSRLGRERSEAETFETHRKLF